MARQLMQQLTSFSLRSQFHQLKISKSVLLYINSLVVKSQCRMLCENVNIVDHTCKISNYDEYLRNYKPVQRILKNTLLELFGISRKEINKMIKDYPQLKKKSRADILNNYYTLMEVGIHKSTIVNNIWLLAYENNKLVDKLECIKGLNMDNNQLVPWLCLTQEELLNYVLHIQQDIDSYTYNRLEYLSHKLECSIQQLCEITVLNPFLIKIPLSHIEKKLNILYEYNISNKDIVKDAWVLRYSEKHIRNRCELYKDTGKLKIKTWAIRCPLDIISRAIQKNRIERNLMQHHENVSEYLQNKLKVDEETLNLTVKKTPGILRVNIAKLDQLIDILCQNGITGNEILRHARIFYFNVETIQNRIQTLKKDNHHLNLSMLIQSDRVFYQYVETNNIRQKLLREYGSIKNFLINKLGVDEKLLEEALAAYPTILRIKLPKLIELIDLLQQNGITGHDIISHPKIFYFNIETIRKRIEMLKKAGVPLKINSIINNISLHNICNQKNMLINPNK